MNKEGAGIIMPHIQYLVHGRGRLAREGKDQPNNNADDSHDDLDGVGRPSSPARDPGAGYRVPSLSPSYRRPRCRRARPAGPWPTPSGSSWGGQPRNSRPTPTGRLGAWRAGWKQTGAAPARLEVLRLFKPSHWIITSPKTALFPRKNGRRHRKQCVHGIGAVKRL